ncbi:diguanylate cyclase [Thioalkalivibrio sp. K90mix]|jgi:diguanylate cyclase (GGDEF)-like protein|uniref:GGDEF domain-containing protein n=1 Tax=Thioalkalivibrio sp. (strain K90mix) TaxID=396595 RepID=UPI00019598A8|nr:GGDEF domain-containing protein [Thioalkalivibrio sp. K90mix]ADC72829.1 diguanylate cyclase [Thioalkalivibrio sp. K90mix]
MNRDGNAGNLRLVSGKGKSTERPEAPFDALAFVQSLTATLEFDAVLQRLQEQLHTLLQHSGWIFYTDGDDQSWSGGEDDRHRIEYGLSYNGATMGSLILMRGRRFSDAEQQQIEALLGLAAPALHNAHRFRRLMSNLESDELTGLGNRRAFEIQGAKWLADCRRQDRPLSVLAIDLDHFKRINDDYGHAVGDELLRRVADTLRAATRQSDLLVRMGGEEFLAVLPGADLACAMECAERIRTAIANIRATATADDASALQSEGMVKVTASIGVASVGRSTTLQALYQKADEALYAAKQSGRNRVLAGN